MSAANVCGKHSTFGVIAWQEFDRAEPAIFILPVRFNVVLSVHRFSLIESPFSRIRGRTRDISSYHSVLDGGSSGPHRTTDYATVLFPLPGISNDLELVRLL